MSATANGHEWLSVAEAADRLGCHPRTIYDGVANDTVPGRRVGRRVLIPSWWIDGDDLRPTTNGDGPAAGGTAGPFADPTATADERGRRERTRAV